jgi:inorganic pyrophosphatase
MDAVDFIGKTVAVEVDRPLGSKHPRWDIIYEVNYGFIPDIPAADGEFQDAYVLGLTEPVQRFAGECIAVIRRLDDAEDKLVVAPPAKNFTDEQIKQATDFQERFFHSMIVRGNPPGAGQPNEEAMPSGEAHGETGVRIVGWTDPPRSDAKRMNPMQKKDALSKMLASLGTVLVWIPLIAPALFAVIQLIRARIFRFDFLMPAELFPLVLIGGLLLLWAALRTRLYRRLVGWSLGLAVCLLLGSQGLAVVTGLASGAAEPAGWPWALVIATLVGFLLAVVSLAIGGALLLRGLFGNIRQPAERQ